MDHKMKYRCADRSRQRRLQRCTNVTDPEDLKSELGAMRLLALETLEQGNTVLADRLLTGIGKLARTQVDVQRARGEYFTRATVARVLEDAVNVLVEAVSGRFEGWEDTIASAADKIAANVANARNEVDE